MAVARIEIRAVQKVQRPLRPRLGVEPKPKSLAIRPHPDRQAPGLPTPVEAGSQVVLDVLASTDAAPDLGDGLAETADRLNRCGGLANLELGEDFGVTRHGCGSVPKSCNLHKLCVATCSNSQRLKATCGGAKTCFGFILKSVL